MNKFYFLVILLNITLSLNATIINVDKSTNRPNGYFGDLQLAINSASNGDTIYLYPSNSSYGNITISKKLNLFGKGYDGTQGSVSHVGNIALDTSSATNSSGSTFQGLTIYYISCSKPNINNIVIAGNYIYNSTGIDMQSNCTGWLIYNNYFIGNLNINYNTSILIANNIFYGNNPHPFLNSNSSSVIFSHNLVMNFQYFYNVYNAIITDNIFICNGDANQTYMAKNKFYNNLSWRSDLNPYLMPPAGNTGSNNISNVSPIFETGTASGAYDYTKDYRLKASSPGKNAASDGTDVGPFGGNKPFVWGGVYGIPFITEVFITNPVINQTTPINVNVKAKKAEL